MGRHDAFAGVGDGASNVQTLKHFEAVVDRSSDSSILLASARR